MWDCHCCCSLGTVLGTLVLAAYVLRWYLKGKSWPHPEYKMHGKVVVITGANSGIGKATALDLASRGAKVYLACRDRGRGEAAQREIVEKTGNKKVLFRPLDLTSLESVRSFAKRFLEEEDRLDVLINNAGMTYLKYKETSDGIEMQMAANHMGHFLLTNLLLDLLKRSAPSRIINISSLAHKRGKIHREDLMNRKRKYVVFNTYCNTKLANILFTRELTRHLLGTGVTANAVHPGVVKTSIWNDLVPTSRIGLMYSKIMEFFFKNPMEGAQTMIRLAVDPELETVTGKYFVDCEEAAVSKAAKNEDDALWLWEESAKYTGLAGSR